MTQYSCPRCGTGVRVGQRTCTHCGQALDPAALQAFRAQQRFLPPAAPPLPPPAPRAPPPARTTRSGCGCLLLVVLLLAGIGSLNPKSPSTIHPPATAEPNPKAVRQVTSTAGAATARPLTAGAPSPALPSPPLPQYGDTVTTAGWVLSLAQLGSADALWGTAGGPVQTTQGHFWLVWLDARNASAPPAALTTAFTWSVQDDRGGITREAATSTQVPPPLLGSFLQRQGRSALTAVIPSGTLTHPLLIFDLPATAHPTTLLVDAGNGAANRFDLRRPPAVTQLRGPPTTVPPVVLVQRVSPTPLPRAGTNGAGSSGAGSSGSSGSSDSDLATSLGCTAGERTGAVCSDGSRSSATGRGACSHHGGVAYWLVCGTR